MRENGGMKHLWALAITGALLATPAVAASFNCGQAKTPFAKAICSNTGLSKADEDVAAAYKAALNGLSDDPKAEVTKAQDNWVKFAQIACTKNAKPATKPYPKDAIECISGLFAGRIEQLQASKTIGGLRFYYVDRYAAAKDPDTSQDISPVATKQVSTPRIDGTGAEAEAFNRFIEAGADKAVDPTLADHITNDEAAEDDTQTITVTAVNDKRIDMTVENSMYGHGAAHGNAAVNYIHYLRDEKRPLKASDIFTGDWEGKLQKIALAQVKKTEGDDLLLDDETSINPLVIDPTRWDFSKEGLVLQFQPYEIAAYAAGAPTVTVPWKDIADLLAPSAKDYQN
jgi:uncharacterized protein